MKQETTTMKPENRFLESDDVELRQEGDQKQQFATGLGIVYDKEVEIYPGLREKIRKGSFNRSLRATDEIKSFFNHDASMVLATTKSDPPLYLEDTDKGLRYKAPIPPTS
jgi:HK97 family phage prohead protease